MNDSLPSLRNRLVRLAAAPLAASMLFLGGCNSLPELLDFRQGAEIDIEAPARTLAAQGMDDYNVGKYFSALEYFEEILDRYPFSQEATLAELKAADCNYYMERYVEAFALYEQFEERHPTNEAIPYVMYQKAMTQYKQMDRVDRDPDGAMEAIRLFDQLQRAFPNSPYALEAKTHIGEAREFLADHEFAVAQFYIRTDKYSQAEKRLRYLLAMYPETKIIPQATELLTLLEAGTPPTAGFTAWLPELPRIDWFDDEESDIEVLPEPNE